MTRGVEPLLNLTPGQRLVFGGDRVALVDESLAADFRPGDRLVIVQSTGALLHIPAAEVATVGRAVSAGARAFHDLATCTDEAISEFFEQFAQRLEDDRTFGPIADANAGDVQAAIVAGRSTTRLELSDRMRADMVAGLLTWRDSATSRQSSERTITHDGWSVELRRAPLGVVGFVFEGRPNVFADACGVVRSGNTVVFRIGSDALGTARAIVAHALDPAIAAAGLPAGTVQLIDSASRSAGHALFDDHRLALAVARGSGTAVAQLGAVAAQAGTPVSLHGTGGAWMIAGEHASAGTLALAVEHSLDRKVCNTLNVCALPRGRAADLVPALLGGIEAAARRLGVEPHVHVVEGSEGWIPAGMLASGVASMMPECALDTEWEWERSPEVSLLVTDTVADAVALANRYSPLFVVSVITEQVDEFERCYESLDAPFVGNGFTRWVDGQYALDLPELGLANWQSGRLLARGAILSGDGVHTVRYVSRVDDHSTHR